MSTAQAAAFMLAGVVSLIGAPAVCILAKSRTAAYVSMTVLALSGGALLIVGGSNIHNDHRQACESRGGVTVAEQCIDRSAVIQVSP